MDIDVFGNDDVLIVNKNLEEDSVVLKELTKIYRNIMKEHQGKPNTPQLNIFFFACHGIDKNANQHIVLNEFNKSTGFYTLQNSEINIRVLSENMKNGYFISIFACCREFFKADSHCGCVGARSKEEA